MQEYGKRHRLEGRRELASVRVEASEIERSERRREEWAPVRREVVTMRAPCFGGRRIG